MKNINKIKGDVVFGVIGQLKLLFGGHVFKVTLGNKYELSCIQHPGSDGGTEGLWEISVFDQEEQKILENPFGTNWETVGHLSETEIKELFEYGFTRSGEVFLIPEIWHFIKKVEKYGKNS